MPKARPVPPRPAARSGVFLRRVANGTLLAVSLKAAQFAAEDLEKFRMFDRGLLDRLKAPLTRYHE